MIDLLSSPDGFIWGWIIAGIVAFDMNIVIDSIVTQILIRIQYPDFRFIDALKVALVGVFSVLSLRPTQADNLCSCIFFQK